MTASFCRMGFEVVCVGVNDRYVVDTGRHKEMRYDHSRGISCLEETWVSKASAKQRRGRAGRVQSGYCIRLFSRQQFQTFDDQQLPEILRVSLDGLCLKVQKSFCQVSVCAVYVPLLQFNEMQFFSRASADLGPPSSVVELAISFPLFSLPSLGAVWCFKSDLNRLDPSASIYWSRFLCSFQLKENMEKKVECRCYN